MSLLFFLACMGYFLLFFERVWGMRFFLCIGMGAANLVAVQYLEYLLPFLPFEAVTRVPFEVTLVASLAMAAVVTWLMTRKSAA